MRTVARTVGALLLVALFVSAAPLASRPVTAHEGHVHVQADNFPRTVMMEQFTAWWCGPCKVADPASHQVLEDYPGRAELVRYHWVNDGLATPQTLDRADTYEVTNLPYMVVDGVLTKFGANNQSEAREAYAGFVDDRLVVPSPLALVVAVEKNATEITVEAVIAAGASARGIDLRVQAIVHESTIAYQSLVHDRVVRSMQNVSVTLSDVPAIESFTFPLNASWVEAQLGVAVFVQEGLDGEVHQAAGGTLTELVAPAAAILSHEDGSTLTVNGGDLQGIAVAPDGVQSVEVRIDAGPWQTADGTEEWTFSLGVPSLTTGGHTVEVRAFDGVKYSETYGITVELPDGSAANAVPGPDVVVVAGLVFATAAVVAAARRKRRD